MPVKTINKVFLLSCLISIANNIPVYAGSVVGDFTFQAEKHKQFADSFAPESLGYLIFFNKEQQVYSRCSGTLIQGSWVLTSAHCGIGYDQSIGAKFVTPSGEADMDAFLPHYKYDARPTYAQSINKGSFDCSSLSGPCRNNPQQAIYDIALVHLSTDMTSTFGLKPIYPSRQKLDSGFYGAFVGYGDQGDGLATVNVGLKTLFNNPTDALNRIDAATSDRLGGQNFFNPFNYNLGQVFITDFDNGGNRQNIDGNPNITLNLEYAPGPGDSGAGVFEGNGNLVAIVSGGGYGNRANPNNPFLPFTVYAPPDYGHQSFFTPLAQHQGWLSNALYQNKSKRFTPTEYISTDINYSPAILPTGNLAGTNDDFLLPDSVFNLISEVDVQPYSEEFDEAVWEDIFPSSSNIPTEPVPEANSLLGIGFIAGTGIIVKRKNNKTNRKS